MFRFYKLTSFLFFLLLSSYSCTSDDDLLQAPKEIEQDSVYQDKYLTRVLKEQHYSKEDILELIEPYIQNVDVSSSLMSLFLKEVDVAAIAYTTTGVDGKPVEASGVIAIPSVITKYDHILSIQHETVDMEAAPSERMLYIEMAPVMQGNVVVMPDYLGYGISKTSDRQHPYLHDQSTGIVCADMIEAAREYLRAKGIKEEDDKVELMGYSQGASSSVSVVYEMEKRGEADRITSVHVGGGVYDLIGTLHYIISIADESEYKHTDCIPFIIRGMEYGEQLSLQDDSIYAPYILEQGLTTMFSTQPLTTWQSKLGEDIKKVLHPDFFAAPTYNGNQDVIQMIEALEKNTLLNYEPTVKITMYHSPNDDFVPYFNSKNAHEKWSNSELIDLDKSNHTEAGIEFFARYMNLYELVKDYL